MKREPRRGFQARNLLIERLLPVVHVTAREARHGASCSH